MSPPTIRASISVLAPPIPSNSKSDGRWEPSKFTRTSLPIGSSLCRKVLHHSRWTNSHRPNFRTHSTRPHNEVWTYGKQAEPILEKYLRLRYELMPYIYSPANSTHHADRKSTRLNSSHLG